MAAKNTTPAGETAGVEPERKTVSENSTTTGGAVSDIVKSGNGGGVERTARSQALREASKDARREMTDAIKEFDSYVCPSTGKASTRPGIAYIYVTRQIYAPFKLNAAREEELRSRPICDVFTAAIFLYLIQVYMAVATAIRKGIKSGSTREQIKESWKAKIGEFAELNRGLIKDWQESR